MLIIFGVRRRGHRMANVFAMCGICHTPAAQSIIRIKTFFTLFFIPLIPLGSKYRSTCTMCGGTIALTKDQADHAMATMHEQRAAAQAPDRPAPVFASQPPVVGPLSPADPDATQWPAPEGAPVADETGDGQANPPVG